MSYDEWGDLVLLATHREEGAGGPGDGMRWLRDAATGLVTNLVYADGTRVSYAYAPDGRLLRRTDARGIPTDYAYDAAGDLASVRHSDGTPSVAYARDRAGRTVLAEVAGVSTGRPLAMLADGRAYLYAHDANGNVAVLVDAGTGEVAARYAYAAFGATLMSEGPLARRNPFRFSSEYADDETGLIYYNWRHYDPVHGAWLGRDPIGVDGGANLYAFCGNDPINFSDKNGTRVNEFESVSLPYSGKRKRSLSFYTLDWYGLIERDSTFDVRTSVSVELLMGGKAEASFGSYGDLADATLKLWEYGTWRTYTEKKNVGVSSGLKARKKYICRARCKEACPLGLRTGTKTISIFERYVIGRTMAIDKEMGHYAADLRRTPNQYRWRSAEFWPDQQKFEQVYRECEKESRAACLSIEDM